jgi:hypothetical protein
MNTAINVFIHRWYKTDSALFCFDEKHTKHQQKQRYLSLKTQIDEGFKLLNQPFSAEDITEEMLTKGIQTAAEFLHMDESACRSLMSKEYAEVTEAFVEKARSLFPEMDSASVFQALRNVWIMVSIQILLGKSVKLTPSIFAYSMLYPLTDNLLDDPKWSRKDKERFNQRFTRRLKGEAVASESIHEDKVYLMVEMIEGEYNRDYYPKVFESLLLIQQGQVMSMAQQGAKNPFETPILQITFFKGAASVLADGYLVAGHITEEMEKFLMGYGIFLQLADDLQDAMADYKNKHMTLFSYSIHDKKSMTALTNRFCQFLSDILKSAPKSLSSEQVAVLRLIEKSCYYLVFDAIYAQKRLFDEALIQSLDEGHVLGFSFHNRLKKEVQGQVKRIKRTGKPEWQNLSDVLQLTRKLTKETKIPLSTT